MRSLRDSLLALLIGACVAAGAARAAVPEGAVAVVNGEPITRSEFGRALVQAVGRAALDSFVDCVLIEQEARKKGLTVTERELHERRELELRLCRRRVLEDARMTQQQWEQFANKYGWTEEHLRRQIEGGLTRQTLRIKLLMEKLLRPHVEVTDAQVRRYYEWTLGERCAVAHICVGSKGLARLLRQRLENMPQAWHSALLQFTLDRASVPHEGRLRPAPASSTLGRVLAGMAPGDLKLFEDGNNWHVLRFMGRVPASDRAFDEVKDDLKRELYVRRVDGLADAWLARLNARACVVVNLSPDQDERRALGAESVAFVNGQPVALSEFADALVGQFGEKFIGPCVERRLIFQQARQAGVTVPQAEMEERADGIAEALFTESAGVRGLEAGEFSALLRGRGITPERYKKELARQSVPLSDVHATLLAERMIAEDVRVTQEDIQRAYESRYGERRDVRQIVVEGAAEAQQVYRKVLRGASFELLVRTESVEPLAWMHRGLVRGVTAAHPFYEYVRGLKVGQLSNVFERKGRYYLLKVVAKHTPGDAPAPASVREELRRKVRREKTRVGIRAWLEKLKAESQIEVALR